MAHVPEIEQFEVFRFDAGDGARVLLQATGAVPTSGWADVHLAPRFYAQAPADGVWEFDFLGRAPAGGVVDTVVTVCACGQYAAPSWLRGVRLYAAGGTQTVMGGRPAGVVHLRGEAPAGAAAAAVCQATLATYDSGFTLGAGDGGGRWRHRLALRLEGPDGALLRRALADAQADGLAAPFVAAYVQGGDALSQAVSRLLRHLHGRLGSAAVCRVDDRAHWLAGPG